MPRSHSPQLWAGSPSGGTQANSVSWRRLWVSRLTTSPSQNTGTETPTRPSPVTTQSAPRPRQAAAISPMARPG